MTAKAGFVQPSPDTRLDKIEADIKLIKMMLLNHKHNTDGEIYISIDMIKEFIVE